MPRYCVDCEKEGKRKRTHFPDEHGNKNQLCSEHAKIRNSLAPSKRTKCFDCLKEGIQADGDGLKFRICAKHVQMYKIDENHKRSKYCVFHAIRRGPYTLPVMPVCIDCLPEKMQAFFENNSRTRMFHMLLNVCSIKMKKKSN